jgi:ureidoacrylate peracid hydrolase
MMWLTHPGGPMHKFSMPEEVIAGVVARVGRTHPFDKLEASKTAFVVIDMQNYYLKPGYLGDVPLAHGIVPAAAVVAVGDY